MPLITFHFRFAYIARIVALCGFWACTALHAKDTGAPDADARHTTASQLSPITVSGRSGGDPLSPSARAAQRRLRLWPGNVGLISEPDYANRPVLGLGDALATAPGIFVQSAAGQQSAKLSIRGSGLASPLGVRGLALLRDGLPLNQADGTVDPSYADPFNARYIEIYRGSNAVQYGAATLGGAINIVSPTGYSHPGLETRLQAGSYGYLQAQARAGQVFENGMDAFASISRYQMRGSALHSHQEATRFYGNLGYRSSARSEGRFHVDVADMDQDIISPLTLAQLQGDANLGTPPPRWPDHRVRTHPHVRLAYQHSVAYGQDDRLSFGAHYIDTTFDLLGTVVPIYYRARDYGASIRGEVNRNVAGHENRLVWGANLALGHSNSQTYGPFTLPGGQRLDPTTGQYEAISTSAQTAQFYIENTYAWNSTLSIVAALQAVSAERRRDITALRNPRLLPAYFKDVDYAKRYNGISPKLGVLWQVGDDAQVYANVSRSFEPPTALEFYNAEGTTEAQRATTFEIGSRGASRLGNWEAALFHSRIKNELLSIPKLGPTGQIIGYQGGNIPDTSHSGLELRLDGELSLNNMAGAIDWAVSYTYSRFRHADDAAFGNNRLPMIPLHYGRIAATYRHPSGVYLGPDMEFASPAYVDQANTLSAPGYGIFNFTIGYGHPSGRYRVFINVRNMADKLYAASTEYMALAIANEAAFNPGLRRSIFAGAEMRW